MWPPIFWALNANCSTTVKGIDCIFDKQVPWDEKLLRGHVRTVPGNALVKFEVRKIDRSKTIDIWRPKILGSCDHDNAPFSIKF